MKLSKIVRLRHQILFASVRDLTDSTYPANVEIVVVDNSNVEEVRSYRTENVQKLFRSYLDREKLGVYAKINGSVVGHAWSTISSVDGTEVNGYLKCRVGEAVIHDCNVDTQHRGKSIYPSMLVNLSTILLSRGEVLRVVIDTEAGNIASLRGIDKAGFSRKGEGWYLQILRRTVWRRQSPDSS